MKFLPLVWKNALRSKRRTVLTVLGVAVSLFILCTLLTVVASMESDADQPSRVGVMSSTNLTTLMPRSHERFLAELPDVALVDKSCWFGGLYKDDRKNFIAQFACDADTYFSIFDDRKIDPAELAAFQGPNKQAAIAGEELAKEYGWKVGDRITLKGTIYPVTLELDIVGTYQYEKEASLQFRYDYLEQLLHEARSPMEGLVGVFWVKAKSADAVPRLMQAIDAHFANSADPTKSMPEKEFARMFQSMMGNIAGLVKWVGAAITVMIFCIMANTMAMSARERVVETAMMRTLGFSAGRILALVLAESIVVTMIGAALGCGGALLAYNVFEIGKSPMMSYFAVTPLTLSIAVALAAAVGVGSGLVPAVAAARRNIVEGLRQVV